MKVTKDNRLKLDSNERRIGNFVIRDEESHMKVMDINQIFTHRASKRTPVGAFLKGSYDALAKDEITGIGLKNWLSAIFTVFSVVPDKEFLENVVEQSKACMLRHPDAYGLTPDGTDAEHDEAAKEVKEMVEFEEEVKNIEENVDSTKS